MATQPVATEGRRNEYEIFPPMDNAAACSTVSSKDYDKSLKRYSGGTRL